uniref:Uncharacterized protein n=1 Tax=Magallana gigas TaxID=29159 RepID=K1QWF2_MAGGI
MVGSRVSLEKLKMPNNGFTTSYLAAESNLGQACCYTRPIQRDVEMIQLDDKNADEDEMVFEECLQCKESIPLLKLRKHIQACTQSLSSDQHPKEAATFFNERSFPSADEVEAFYIPVFSKNEEEKAEEELVIYNWGKWIIVMMDIRECFVKTDVPIQHLEVNVVKDATAASSFVIIQVDVLKCCWETCRSDSRYSESEHMEGVSWFPCPKPITQLEKCQRWVKLCDAFCLDVRGNIEIAAEGAEETVFTCTSAHDEDVECVPVIKEMKDIPKIIHS